jgi:di/tripeptidase
VTDNRKTAWERFAEYSKISKQTKTPEDVEDFMYNLRKKFNIIEITSENKIQYVRYNIDYGNP